MQHVAQVRPSDDVACDWLVWFESKVVGRFVEVGEALALAAMLECSPRARENVAGS
jgi:hypothetical protein